MMMTEGIRLSAWWRLRVILFECYLTFEFGTQVQRNIWIMQNSQEASRNYESQFSREVKHRIWPATFTNGSDTENWT